MAAIVPPRHSVGMNSMRRSPVHFLIAFFGLSATASADDFALKEGDTVVFLGDSITAARTYGKIIENYTLLRFPDRKVRFINAGWGGDTAAGGLARLERDVFDRGATVLTVAYGVNDIGWGLRADDEHKQKYLDAIRDIVGQCKEHKVRVFICSAAITAADPDKAENDFLQRMCDEGLAAAKERGAGAIDIQRSMREVQRRVLKSNETVKDAAKKTTLHAADGVHLNDLGQLAMAAAILKGLGAPADVSSATVDFRDPKSVESAGCKITGIKADASAKTFEFDRLDEGLPITFGLFGALNYAYVPIHEELARYMVGVRNLPAGKYEVLADDRLLGTFSAGQLAKGVNVSFATSNAWQPGGPWDVQATLLKHLTDSRNETSLTQLFAKTYEQPNGEEIAKQAAELNERIERLQREVARPRPYHFIVRPAEEKADEKAKPAASQ